VGAGGLGQVVYASSVFLGPSLLVSEHGSESTW